MQTVHLKTAKLWCNNSLDAMYACICICTLWILHAHKCVAHNTFVYSVRSRPPGPPYMWEWMHILSVHCYLARINGYSKHTDYELA